MESIKSVLMTRDGMSETDADDAVQAAREEFDELLEMGETEEAYNICQEHFGLEPDYVEEFIG